jgi:enoyl-CoA hydratase
VLIDHAEGRGFCAGGDIRMLAESGAADGSQARDFFFVEYRLNHLLFTYQKPTIAFMDGSPWAAASASRSPAAIGSRRRIPASPCRKRRSGFSRRGRRLVSVEAAGPTRPVRGADRARLDGAECLYLGLATHYLPSAGLEEVKARIVAEPAELERILEEASTPPPRARIAENRERIDRLFAADHLEVIISALEEDGSEWAKAELVTLRCKSPQACKVSLRLLADGARMADFADEMRQEYGVATHVVQRHDFVEGVRSVLVDKDASPRWDPPTPHAVTDHMIDTIFAPLPEDEQWTPLGV